MTASEDLLHRVQDKLREIYGPLHYYTTTYSQQEATYSGSVPEWMAGYIQKAPGLSRVLDIGCAYGTLSAFAASLDAVKVTSLDIRRLLSPQVEQMFNLEYIQHDVERVEFPYFRHFDAVIITEVLEHFNFHPLPTLWKIRAMMKLGASMFLSTPDASSWGRIPIFGSLESIPPYPGTSLAIQPWFDGHVWQYTEWELRQVLEMAGFTVKRLDYSTSIGGRHFNLEATA